MDCGLSYSFFVYPYLFFTHSPYLYSLRTILQSSHLVFAHYNSYYRHSSSPPCRQRDIALDHSLSVLSVLLSVFDSPLPLWALICVFWSKVAVHSLKIFLRYHPHLLIMHPRTLPAPTQPPSSRRATKKTQTPQKIETAYSKSKYSFNLSYYYCRRYTSYLGSNFQFSLPTFSKQSLGSEFWCVGCISGSGPTPSARHLVHEWIDVAPLATNGHNPAFSVPLAGHGSPSTRPPRRNARMSVL